MLAHGRWFSPGTPSYSTTKTGGHDIVEILLKVASNTKNQINSNLNTSRQFNSDSYIVKHWMSKNKYMLCSDIYIVRCWNSELKYTAQIWQLYFLTLNVLTQIYNLVMTSILLDVECHNTNIQLTSDNYFVGRWNT